MAELLQITRGGEYAIAALKWLASQPEGEVVNAETIADSAGIPVQFASNIFTRLAKVGLLRAHRGAKRGYSLSRSPKKISILDVIEGYEGPLEKPWCLLNREQTCSGDAPCALHTIWQDLREHVQKKLAKITIASLAEGD